MTACKHPAPSAADQVVPAVHDPVGVPQRPVAAVVTVANTASASFRDASHARSLDIRLGGEWQAQQDYVTFRSPQPKGLRAVTFKIAALDEALMFAWTDNTAPAGFPGTGNGVTVELRRHRAARQGYFTVTLRPYADGFGSARVANGLFRLDPDAVHEMSFVQEGEALIFTLNGVSTRLTDFPSLDHAANLHIGATGGAGEKLLQVYRQGAEGYGSIIPDPTPPLMIQKATSALPEEPAWQWDFNNPARSYRYTARQQADVTTYHFSSSYAGDDSDGSKARPYTDFTTLSDSTIRLEPGVTIALKRGDTFSSLASTNAVMHLSADQHRSGTPTNAMVITAYGDAATPLPVIRPGNVIDKYGIQINSLDYIKIENLRFERAKVGVFLKTIRRLDQYDTIENVEIGNCTFSEIRQNNPAYFADFPENWSTDNNGNGIFWNAGIFLGADQGCAPDPGTDVFFRNIHLHDLTFTHCDVGIGNAVYYPDTNQPLGFNVFVENCSGSDVLQGGFMFNLTQGITVDNFKVRSGGGYAGSGICGGFLQYVSDVRILNSSFNGIIRESHDGDACHDGVGFDLEGGVQRAYLSRCEFRNNAGAGLLICGTDPWIFDADGKRRPDRRATPNRDIYIRNCRFADNGQNPDSNDYPERLGQTAYDIVNWQTTSGGDIRSTSFNSPLTTAPFSHNMMHGFTYAD